jgi:transcriptional regulator with XRE-family HTH domain
LNEGVSTINSFGVSLKKIRLKKKITLKQLSALSGISVAMLSQIELGDKVPTIRVAGQIAAALSMSISDLVGDAKYKKRGYIVRKDSRRKVFNPLTGMEGQLISPGRPPGSLDIIYSSLAPFSGSGPMPPHELGSEEYLLIVAGRLTVILNQSETYHLEAGDAIFFEGNILHEIRNDTETECTYYLVLNH